MSRFHPRRAGAGFTVIELMVVLAVAAILAALALPSFNAAIERNRIIAQTNDFIAATMLARTEAIRRNGAAGVCASNNNSTPATATCAGTWSNGWIVWVDADSDGVADAGEALRTGNFSASDTVSEATSVVAVVFNQRGRRATPATGLVELTLEPTACKAGTVDVARTVRVNTSGSASVARPNPNCT